MPSPNLSKSSSTGSASLAPSLDRQVRSSTSAVILAIVILNTLGIVLLFFKLDWDVRQLSMELGLVRDVVKTEKTAREKGVIEGAGTMEESQKRLSELPVHAYVFSETVSQAEEPPLTVYALYELPRSLWLDDQNSVEREQLQEQFLDPIADLVSLAWEAKPELMIVSVPPLGSEDSYSVDILDENGVYSGYTLERRGELSGAWSARSPVCENFLSLSQDEIDFFIAKYPNSSTCILGE